MVKARQDCPTRNNRRTSLAAALALLARDASAANVGDPPRNLSAYPVIGQATLNWDAPTSGTPTGYLCYQEMSSARMSRGETLLLVMQPAQDRPTHDLALAPGR